MKGRFWEKLIAAGQLCAEAARNLKTFLKWILMALITGGVVGGVGSLFYYTLSWATQFRQDHSWTLFLLPVAGLLIIFLYRVSNTPEPKGTNLVIEAVRTDTHIPAKMAPLIFVSTALTHLFGGSAGREGAALQLGGSLGNLLGRVFHTDEMYKNIMIMCGMSAAFSALFGTPVAATVFAMEMESVGVMYYAALVPCALSAVVAFLIAEQLKIPPEGFHLEEIPPITLGVVFQVMLLAVLCALVSILFCFCLHQGGKLMSKSFPNQYLRAFIGGLAVIVLTFLCGSRDYLGAGMDVIHRAMEGQVVPAAFLLKILFTAVTLGSGFKGGEIVPTFFVGATFGCLAGQWIGLSPSFCAALGLVAMFCAVTNCPITALLISFELFGFAAPPLFLLALAVSYMLSGYYSLYSAQKIVYDKTKPRFINRPTH